MKTSINGELSEEGSEGGASGVIGEHTGRCCLLTGIVVCLRAGIAFGPGDEWSKAR